MLQEGPLRDHTILEVYAPPPQGIAGHRVWPLGKHGRLARAGGDSWPIGYRGPYLPSLLTAGSRSSGIPNIGVDEGSAFGIPSPCLLQGQGKVFQSQTFPALQVG